MQGKYFPPFSFVKVLNNFISEENSKWIVYNSCSEGLTRNYKALSTTLLIYFTPLSHAKY